MLMFNGKGVMTMMMMSKSIMPLIALDSIAVPLFVDWLSFKNTESEGNPNNNQMMRHAGLSILLTPF